MIKNKTKKLEKIVNYRKVFKEAEMSDSTRQAYTESVMQYIRIRKKISQVELFSIFSKKSKFITKDFLRNAMVVLRDEKLIKIIPGICTPEGLFEISSKEAKDFIEQMKEYSGYDFNPSSCIVTIIKDISK